MNTTSNAFSRHSDERFEDYFVRLFENKQSYGLNCKDIASLLNQEKGVNYDESAWRKEYAAFNRGRQYTERKKQSKIKNRILCISDLHIPFEKPVETFSEYVGVCDTIIINGDVSDCQAISKFPKTYKIPVMEEMIKTRDYILELANYINPKKIVITYGNHDIRFSNYLSKSLDTDMSELMPQTMLELIIDNGFHHYDKRSGTKTFYEPIKNIIDGIEIEYVDSWFYQIGKVIFCHPLAFSVSIMKTAEKAVLFFRNEGYDFKTLVMAHTHRLGSYKVGNTFMYEQGCCCDTKKQHYADGRLTNSQKEGFMYMCLDDNGEEITEYTKLIDLN